MLLESISVEKAGFDDLLTLAIILSVIFAKIFGALKKGTPGAPPQPERDSEIDDPQAELREFLRRIAGDEVRPAPPPPPPPPLKSPPPPPPRLVVSHPHKPKSAHLPPPDATPPRHTGTIHPAPIPTRAALQPANSSFGRQPVELPPHPPLPAADLARVLRNHNAVRNAIILSEILAPPLAFRPHRETTAGALPH